MRTKKVRQANQYGAFWGPKVPGPNRVPKPLGILRPDVLEVSCCVLNGLSSLFINTHSTGSFRRMASMRQRRNLLPTTKNQIPKHLENCTCINTCSGSCSAFSYDSRHTSIIPKEEDIESVNLISNLMSSSETNLDKILDDIVASDKYTMNAYTDLETNRASFYLKRRILVEEGQDELEKRFKDVNFRVKLLMELISSPPHDYELLATHVPAGTIGILRKPNLTPRDILSDGQKKIIVDIMVDMDCYIWQEKGAINEAFIPVTENQKERNSFRSARSGLWNTAANRLQNEQKKLHGKDSGSITRPSRGGGGSTFSKYRPLRSTANNQKWYTKFYEVQRKLRDNNMKFLRNDFLKCERLVTDDPILVEAQQSSNRRWISTNRNPTISRVGLFDVKDEGHVLHLSEVNQRVFKDYIDYVKKFTRNGQHYLGPFFCHYHSGSGYALHATRVIKPGEFLMYVGECKFEGDRRSCRVQDGEIEEDDNENLREDTQDDLFTLTHHKSGDDDFECVIDPKKYSNVGRYIGGVSPKNLNDANCMPFVVRVDEFYHIIIVVFKEIQPGGAALYYYRGLKGEKDFEKIPAVGVPKL